MFTIVLIKINWTFLPFRCCLFYHWSGESFHTLWQKVMENEFSNDKRTIAVKQQKIYFLIILCIYYILITNLKLLKLEICSLSLTCSVSLLRLRLKKLYQNFIYTPYDQEIFYCKKLLFTQQISLYVFWN